MQLIIKNGQVAATHEDHQSVVGLYPGCEIVSYTGHFDLDPLGLNLDPRTVEEKSLAYRDQRRLAYPSVVDQLDMIYWDHINGTTEWQDSISVIKARYPK